MTISCDLEHLESCFCDSEFTIAQKRAAWPVEARMPDLQENREAAPSRVLTGLFAVAALAIVVVYVGLPMVLAVDARIESLPLAIGIGVAILVLASAAVLWILRRTATTRPRPKHAAADAPTKKLMSPAL